MDEQRCAAGRLAVAPCGELLGQSCGSRSPSSQRSSDASENTIAPTRPAVDLAVGGEDTAAEVLAHGPLHGSVACRARARPRRSRASTAPWRRTRAAPRTCRSPMPPVSPTITGAPGALSLVGGRRCRSAAETSATGSSAPASGSSAAASGSSASASGSSATASGSSATASGSSATASGSSATPRALGDGLGLVGDASGSIRDGSVGLIGDGLGLRPRLGLRLVGEHLFGQAQLGHLGLAGARRGAPRSIVFTGSPGSTRRSESDSRRRSGSISMILTLTSSPCCTTSRGFSTWCSASSEMWIRPSTPGHDLGERAERDHLRDPAGDDVALLRLVDDAAATDRSGSASGRARCAGGRGRRRAP